MSPILYRMSVQVAMLRTCNVQLRSGCLLPSVTYDIPEYSIVRTCTLRLLSRAISLFLFPFLLLSYCLTYSLSHISTHLKHAVMNDNSAPETISRLPIQSNASGVEADQYAAVPASSNTFADKEGKMPWSNRRFNILALGLLHQSSDRWR